MNEDLVGISRCSVVRDKMRVVKNWRAECRLLMTGDDLRHFASFHSLYGLDSLLKLEDRSARSDNWRLNWLSALTQSASRYVLKSADSYCSSRRPIVRVEAVRWTEAGHLERISRYRNKTSPFLESPLKSAEVIYLSWKVSSTISF